MSLVNYEWSDIASLMNEQVKGRIGEENLVAADLTNIADFGKVLTDAELNKVIEGLLVKITKTIIEDKNLQLEFPYLFKDSDEWGGIIEKIKIVMPESTSPQNHNKQDGQVFTSELTYHSCTVKVKLWEGPEASFEFDYSIENKDIKKGFSGPNAFQSFISARHNAIRKAIKQRLNVIARDALLAMTARTLYQEMHSVGYGDGSGVRCVNLLYRYNHEVLNPDADDYVALTAEKCRFDKEFQRFARREISAMPQRLKEPSVLYNIEGDVQWSENIHTILLNDFVMDNKAYFLTDAYRDEIALPEHDTVDSWQASGTKPTFLTRSKINVTPVTGENVELTGLLGVMFDDMAVCIYNQGENARSNNVASGDFQNYYVTVDGKAILQPDENFVVFYVADESAE